MFFFSEFLCKLKILVGKAIFFFMLLIGYDICIFNYLIQSWKILFEGVQLGRQLKNNFPGIIFTCMDSIGYYYNYVVAKMIRFLEK